VRRPAGPWTETIHALLRHVRARGFVAAPEPLGRDAEGREILAFVAGEVPRYPLPGWVWDDSALTAAAALLRRLHDATAGFDPPAAHWRLPPREPAEVVCHNDFAPHNLVFRDRVPVAVIDFDTAAPGPRAWDLAHLAYRLVPLTGPDNADAPATPEPERDRRLTLLCASYGPEADPAAVLAAVPERLDALRDVTLARVRDGGPPELRAHAALYAADAAYVRARLGADRSGGRRTSGRR
jgi:aminoglycoside phosphotransferase (APT) family kinase protein